MSENLQVNSEQRSVTRKYEPLSGYRKTHCFCVYCPHHPLFEKRSELPRIMDDFDVSYGIIDPVIKAQGADVECLKFESDAFEDLDLNKDDFDFPQTGYQDGSSLSGVFKLFSYELIGYCGNESYAGNGE
jgi:hypothetical protein